MVSVIILILAASPAEAEPNNTRPFTLAERQLLLIERMTNSALLAALGIDASPGLSSIHWSRGRFDRMQTDLREGNPYIGLSPTTEPKILETLDQADSRWRHYDSIFGEIVASGKVSEAQVDALAVSHANMIEALRQMVDSYGYFVYGGRYHSILSSTINGTGRLRASTQLVLRSLMMAAYHDYATEQRQQLAQSTKEFDETINGLIEGNPERRLLPAATREIRGELMKVDEMWTEIRPILERAVAGEAVTKDQIATVARYANDMAVPLTMALMMYLSV
ncbi:MAG: type IV pili methyl-accepting chemotaxis transducer N-terminal domain-containing protein [Rhodospirillales bacterium]|nr:type IV pili methyl-accepting chemotaxis transducer N-terminal domain-containing protein [Rhodospirillales bacterium]